MDLISTLQLTLVISSCLLVALKIAHAIIQIRRDKKK